MRSMTGYGRGSVSSEGRQITVELKSVNHRFLDVAVRLPHHLLFLEDAVRARLAASFSRGHIDVFVNYVNLRSDAKTVSVNTGLLAAYAAAAREANRTLGLEDDFTLAKALGMPDVTVISEADEDQAAVSGLAFKALDAAIAGLSAMRLEEGARLREDLSRKVGEIARIKDRIAERAPLVIDEYRERLNARVAELAAGHELDSARLATEVAIFADRASIDEEIVRLTSHLTAMDGYLASSEPVGSNINFLVQEMNREINTIGSKANDAVLAGYVISAKAELEKVREQIQNIE